jgi:hypothetical protein
MQKIYLASKLIGDAETWYRNNQDILEQENFEEFVGIFKGICIHPEMFIMCLKQIRKIEHTGFIEEYIQEFDNFIKQCLKRLHTDNIIDFCNGVT